MQHGKYISIKKKNKKTNQITANWENNSQENWVTIRVKREALSEHWSGKAPLMSLWYLSWEQRVEGTSNGNTACPEKVPAPRVNGFNWHTLLYSEPHLILESAGGKCWDSLSQRRKLKLREPQDSQSQHSQRVPVQDPHPGRPASCIEVFACKSLNNILHSSFSDPA